MDKKDDFSEEIKEMIKNHKFIENLKIKFFKQHFSKGALNLKTLNLNKNK